jgi:hypothetical protein
LLLLCGELVKVRLVDGFQAVAVMIAGEQRIEGISVVIGQTGGSGESVSVNFSPGKPPIKKFTN